MNFTRLFNNFFIGDAEAAADATLLKAHGITAVVNVAAEINDPMYTDRCTYFKFPLYDDDLFTASEHIQDEQAEWYKSAVDSVVRLMSDDHVVLVHCAMGISRSSAVCIGSLKKMNYGSWSQCEDFLRDNHPSSRLLNRGVLDYMAKRVKL